MYEFLPLHMRALYSAHLIPSYLINLTILGEVGKQTTLLLYTQFYIASPSFYFPPVRTLHSALQSRTPTVYIVNARDQI